MEKSKSSRSLDRLGNLPDSLIFEIFWFLPITDVVKTTILSKRWKDLWRTSPFLNFDGYVINRFSNYVTDGSLDKFRDLINRVLIFWRGVKIVKFKIKFKFDLTQPLATDVGVWVRFAKEKQVEELYLDLLYAEEDDFDLAFECLYSCSLLKVLWLRSCRLEIVNIGKVKWDRLESLTIHDNSLNQDAITKVLFGSPKLEVIFWSFCDRGKDLRIRSSSLKKLSIEKYLDFDDDDDDFSRKTELEIRTPNLKRLELLGLPYEKFLLNVSSLTDVTLGFCGLSECDNVGDLNLFLEGSLKQILPAIQGVERVTLSDWCVEVLGDMNKKCLLSPLLNVKFLKLNIMLSKHIRIAGLLGIFPELKRLVIKDENVEDYLDVRESLEFEANLPNSYLMQLRTVDFTWVKGGYAIFSFIEIILKYASNLEEMVFRVKTTFDITERYAVSQKLLRMEKSSQTAQLIFCEY